MKHVFFTFLFLLFYLFSFSQVKLDSGLVAYYPFNGDANDASGNGNNPVFNNATLTTGQSNLANTAYYFNGINNYMQIPSNPSLTPQELTLFAIVKPFGFYHGACYNNCIIDKGSPDYLSGDYSLRFTQAAYSGSDCNNPDSLHQNFVGYSYLNNSAPLYTPYVTKNTWYCIAYTVSSDSVKLYVDGILKWEQVKSVEIGINSQDVFLGRKNNSQYPYWFNGVMDEVRIYNRALNHEEINALCPATSEPPCNSWLQTPSTSSYITVGDIDVTGDQLTVEASFNRSSAFENSSDFGKLVSKHTGETNVNYSLMPLQCEITTDISGYIATPQVCLTNLDKTYHVAMVYDGISLKFYRNGFLLTNTPCTGNLINNDLLTTIGQIAGNGYPDLTQFKGYINEVRIWNVARTQEELRANMNTILPNPATQSGLLAYYRFNDLINKQGNSTYDGVLGGNASTNTTNPNCSFTADSCDIALPVTLINFSANSSDNQVKLKWNVAEELGIDHYVVERSTNGYSDFISIGTIQAGNNNDYFIIDENIKPDITYYYRLVMVEKNSLKKYSDIKTVRLVGHKDIVNIYPNPSSGKIKVLISNYKGKVDFTIINSLGQTVIRKNEIISNSQPVLFDIRKKSKGIYWLKVVIGSEIIMKKILIQ